MKRISIISVLMSACLTILALAGCTKEKLDTAQLDDEQVRFSAFAPNPVARGGVLRIIGSNLQKVSQVEIPGVEPLTEIEVKSSGKVSEIWVTVPVEGPEVGRITIVADGQKLTSKTDLEYSEPIVFDGFEPLSAMPGDVVTIKGDYMNNIHEVIFEGNAKVVEFEAQTRHELKVKVPSNAVTGKFIIGDVDEDNNPDGKVANLFYSDKELQIGNPTIKSVERGTLKAGKEITVEGAYLDMISSVNFAGTAADFKAAKDGKTLVTTVPATAVDGEVALVSFAGVEFEAGTYETLVPSELAVDPMKDRYKAGLDVMITGKDLDLVTGAALAGTSVDYIVAEDYSNIVFTIPAAAVDGAVTLTLANGKTVDSEAITLVKPTITAVSPQELFAGDGNVKVEGTDLDLVASATLGGKAIDIKDGATDKALELVTSLTSVSGKVVLTLANGVTVESADEVKVNYHSKVIVTEMTKAQHIGEEVVLKGSKFDLVENIFIGDNKVTQYSIRTPEEVRFLMPWCTAGSYSMSFHLFSGDVETVATPIEVQLERAFKVVFEGEAVINWNNNAQTPFALLSEGATIIAEYTCTPADYHMLRLINTDWSFNPDGVAAYNKNFDESGVWSIPVTKDLLTQLDGKDLCFTGFGCNLTKVTVVTEIPQETTIWEGSTTVTWSGGALTTLSWGGYDWSTASVGQKVTAYFSVDAADACLRFGNGSWVSMPSVMAAYPDAGDGNVPVSGLTSLSFTISDADMEQLTSNGGLVICGTGYTLTKVTIL